MKSFERYCVLTLVRALDQLKFALAGEQNSQLDKGAALRLKHSTFDQMVDLVWNGDGTLHLNDRDSHTMLRVAINVLNRWVNRSVFAHTVAMYRSSRHDREDLYRNSRALQVRQ